jgi:hypothetical protein
MNTITAVLQADSDGSLHLPLPPELRHGMVRVEAKLEAVSPAPNDAQPATSPLEAFKALRAQGGLRHVIPDPVAWQREQRRERPLSGRV